MGRAPPPHSSDRSGFPAEAVESGAFEKFSLPSVIVEGKIYNQAKKSGVARPFEQDDKVVITSYEFAATKADDIAHGRWDLVVFDEAHRLRNVYKQGASMRAKKLRDATRAFSRSCSQPRRSKIP